MANETKNKIFKLSLSYKRLYMKNDVIFTSNRWYKSHGNDLHNFNERFRECKKDEEIFLELD